MKYDDDCRLIQSHSEPSQTFLATHAPISLLKGLESRMEQRRKYLSTPLSQERLHLALQHEQWEVRSAVIERLGSQGELAPLNLLEPALHDKSPYVRMAALRAMGQMGAHTPKDLLCSGLQDCDWQVREIAVLTLGALEDPAMVEMLETALRDVNSEVREAARLVLRQWEKDDRKELYAHPGITSPSPVFLTLRSERKQTAMSLVQQSSETPVLPASANTGLLVSTSASYLSVRKRLPRGIQLTALVATLVLMLGILTAAGFGWWNSRFGDPSLYTTINQQQTHHDVTVKITKVYADEGHTIIAYDIISNDSTKQYILNNFDLVGSVPQKQEALGGTYGDRPEQGVTHFYMVEPHFLVPANVGSLTLTLNIGEMIVTQSGKSESTTITGPWHFSFTVPFHHENNTHLPDPIHGDVSIK